MGVNFIMNRDAAIWDYTFGQAGYTTSRLTKKKLMRGQDNDFRAVKCLDLFDGKPHCFDPSMLLSIKRYQRVSRLYGLRDTLWSKDNFCETMSASLRDFYVEREFVFPCWMLPRDYPILMKQVKNEYADRSFILKPTDRGEGSGIVIFDKASELPRWKRSFPDLDEVVVQTYLPNPYLIDGYKWDMRTYVLVTSIHPLRAYMFRDGLVRFAGTPYDPKRKAGALTNVSLNKNKTKSAEDLTWPFPKVYRWLKRKGHDPDQLWDRIEAAVTMMLLSAEPGFVKKFQKLQRGYACANCYQLLGVDVIVDDTVTPRVIEVNGEPSMQLSGQDGSQYDRTKKSMTHDLVQLVYSNDDSSLQLTADLMELELDGVRLGFEGSAAGCRADVYDVCLSQRDVEYLLEMKREEGKMDGARFDTLIDHLKTKFPGDVNEGSFRIHRVATALSKFTSRIRFQNSIDDPEYVE
ncbi:Tubulin polyglutamylase TTLL4 [Hondaea fermentalgiana]|uniref:Tubulin polyglutamylase TTLL4 n=1 Tax=Hondaea fermentalgiana TaxID=2315210 RepID=A0A2R5GTH3_9STRA|nr:Tubulin polyglutamylase TTLL4 [Hondaea fermentalgiana]|eukprot:GBG34162.1 Tubulin polyglutamylase TTLL4 [Hondaea fermentalgiana]